MKKKKCLRCNKEIERNFDFCPWCGEKLAKKTKSDYGLLGETDDEFFSDKEIFFPIDRIFERIFSDMNNLFSNSSIEKKANTIPFNNIQIKFSTFSPRREISYNKNKNDVHEQKKNNKRELSDNPVQIVKAEAKFRRLPEGVVYEIFAPGVKSREDIVINRIEGGIEIRAYTKDKCYVKTIPLKVDSFSYSVKENKVILTIKE
ncbi:MAG: zinc ribbon domain-containing protein [Candidatus Pacearchaeota archaeon]